MMLKGGVIGFGRMGVVHHATLNTHPDVQMVAVCDPSTFVLKSVKRFKDWQTFTDYRAMLDGAELDFVVVATPTASHSEISTAAAQRGLHVFLEKPFALDTGEGRALTALLESKGLVNHVGYFLRYNSVFRAVKSILVEGLIGQVIHHKSETYGRTVLKPSKSSWRAEKKMGGGCMMDFASHCLDLSDYLFGPIRRVPGSLLRKVYSTEVEDAVYANVEHESGVTGTVLANWSDESYRRPYNRIEVLGTRGKVVADRQEYRLYLSQPDEKGRYPKGWSVKYLPELEEPARFQIRGPEFTHQLDDFVACMKKARPRPACTFADALRTDCTMEMIRQNAGGGA